MKIHLKQIPPGGTAHFEGEDDCPIKDLGHEEAECAGPLRYALDVGVSEGSLWANGSIEQPVTLRCVSCLERFDHTIRVPNFAVMTELRGPETVDLTPLAREDILLNLPPYPHCDQHGGRQCKASFAKPATEDDSTTAEQKRAAAWGALDKLDL